MILEALRKCFVIYIHDAGVRAIHIYITSTDIMVDVGGFVRAFIGPEKR